MRRIAGAVVTVLLFLMGAMMLLPPRTEDDSVLTGAAARGLLLLDDEQGVYVLAVTDGSPADTAGVQPGDYLLSADGIPIDQAQRADEMMDGLQEPLLLQINRNGQSRTISLPVR